MRIGIDARFYGSVGKGLGRYTQKLIEYLERIDTDNEYIVFLRRENFSEYVPKNRHFRKVLAQYHWYGWSEQCLFPILLYVYRLDLVHFPHFNVPLLYRRPFVVTIHDLILLHYPTLRATTRPDWLYRIKFLVYQRVIGSAIRRANWIITVSDFTKQDIVRQYPLAKAKITVTYEAADARESSELSDAAVCVLKRIGICSSSAGARGILKPYVLYVGNAYPHKNLERLIEAAEHLPHIVFVLVGKEDFFYARLKRSVFRRNLRNVVFTGYITDDELEGLYRTATLYAFPSLYEGFGLPPLEAMARGLPVLSSDRASMPEILGDAAAYADPEEPGVFEQAIERLMMDHPTRIRLREAGFGQVGKYDWQEMASATLGIYSRVFQEQKNGAHIAEKTRSEG